LLACKSNYGPFVSSNTAAVALGHASYVNDP